MVIEMGLAVGKVKLEKYNSNWEEEFKKEKEQLSKMFGNIAISIEHIGSTAVVGISAKTIIDIVVGVNKLEDKEYAENRKMYTNSKAEFIKKYWTGRNNYEKNNLYWRNDVWTL